MLPDLPVVAVSTAGANPQTRREIASRLQLTSLREFSLVPEAFLSKNVFRLDIVSERRLVGRASQDGTASEDLDVPPVVHPAAAERSAKNALLAPSSAKLAISIDGNDRGRSAATAGGEAELVNRKKFALLKQRLLEGLVGVSGGDSHSSERTQFHLHAKAVVLVEDSGQALLLKRWFTEQIGVAPGGAYFETDEQAVARERQAAAAASTAGAAPSGISALFRPGSPHVRVLGGRVRGVGGPGQSLHQNRGKGKGNPAEKDGLAAAKRRRIVVDERWKDVNPERVFEKGDHDEEILKGRNLFGSNLDIVNNMRAANGEELLGREQFREHLKMLGGGRTSVEAGAAASSFGGAASGSAEPSSAAPSGASNAAPVPGSSKDKHEEESDSSSASDDGEKPASLPPPPTIRVFTAGNVNSELRALRRFEAYKDGPAVFLAVANFAKARVPVPATGNVRVVVCWTLACIRHALRFGEMISCLLHENFMLSRCSDHVLGEVAEQESSGRRRESQVLREWIKAGTHGHRERPSKGQSPSKGPGGVPAASCKRPSVAAADRFLESLLTSSSGTSGLSAGGSRHSAGSPESPRRSAEEILATFKRLPPPPPPTALLFANATAFETLKQRVTTSDNRQATNAEACVKSVKSVFLHCGTAVPDSKRALRELVEVHGFARALVALKKREQREQVRGGVGVGGCGPRGNPANDRAGENEKERIREDGEEGRAKGSSSSGAGKVMLESGKVGAAASHGSGRGEQTTLTLADDAVVVDSDEEMFPGTFGAGGSSSAGGNGAASSSSAASAAAGNAEKKDPRFDFAPPMAARGPAGLKPRAPPKAAGPNKKPAKAKSKAGAPVKKSGGKNSKVVQPSIHDVMARWKAEHDAKKAAEKVAGIPPREGEEK